MHSLFVNIVKSNYSMARLPGNTYNGHPTVTFELYGHLICLQVFLLRYNYIYIYKYCLTQWIMSFEIHWAGQYLVNYMGLLVGIVNTTVYKTEPIFIGLWPGQVS